MADTRYWRLKWVRFKQRLPAHWLTPSAQFYVLFTIFLAVMSHSYSQDRHWLGSVLQGAPAYIGQLGPRDRTERLLDEIRQHSTHLPALERLHYPIGLDIGGDTPESVATAILAEMTAALNERTGGMLKHRQAAIHTPTTQGCSEIESATRRRSAS